MPLEPQRPPDLVVPEWRSSDSRLDRGTKIYIDVLAAVELAILIAWFPSLDFRAWEINDRLSQDRELSAYPFPFRVLEIDTGVAVVNLPVPPTSL